jgi:hypothetical protein
MEHYGPPESPGLSSAARHARRRPRVTGKAQTMARTPDKRQPWDPAKAMRERAAAEAQRTAPTLTNAQKLAGRPLLRPEKPPPADKKD